MNNGLKTFIFAGSILLNLLLLGYVGGLHIGAGDASPNHHSRHAPTPAIAALSNDQRQRLRGIMRDAGRGMRSQINDDTYRAAVRDALTATPFNTEDALAALQANTLIESAARERMHAAIIAEMETLPEDERAALADILTRAHRRRGRLGHPHARGEHRLRREGPPPHRQQEE